MELLDIAWYSRKHVLINQRFQKCGWFPDTWGSIDLGRHAELANKFLQDVVSTRHSKYNLIICTQSYFNAASS